MLDDLGLMATASSPLGVVSSDWLCGDQIPFLKTYPAVTVSSVSYPDLRGLVLTLIYEVGERDVVCIHCVEPVGILDPIRAVRCRKSSVVDIDVVKPHIRAVHDIDRPQW